MRVIYTREYKRDGTGSETGGRRSLILSLSDLCLSWEIVLITRQAKRNQKRGKSRDTRDFHRLLDLQEACNRVRIRVSYTSWRGGWLEWKHSLNISTWCQMRGYVSPMWIRMKKIYQLHREPSSRQLDSSIFISSRRKKQRSLSPINWKNWTNNP